MPVMPGASLREPTLNHCQKHTAGTLWSSWVRITRPFGSTWRPIGKDAGVSAAPELAGDVAVFAAFFEVLFAAFRGAAPTADASTNSRAAAARNERMKPPGFGT